MAPIRGNKFKNSLGKKFGRLLVIKEAGLNKFGCVLWKCVCDCGNECIVTGSNLRSGHSKSCGCLQREVTRKSNFRDLTGRKFKRFTVLREVGQNKHGCVLWECLCNCGNIRIVLSNSLLSGNSKSCGCLQKERAGKFNFKDLTGMEFNRWTVIKEAGRSRSGGVLWLCKCKCGTERIVKSDSLISGSSQSCGCITKERCGSLSHAWRGGISAEPYCFIFQDLEYKDYIFERDNYQCLNTECSKISNKLCRHHIDYNKKNCAKENLILLCNSCNGKANKNRKWHTNWYQTILYRRYGYLY